MASSSDSTDLKLRYAGSLVEQLGAQLYPSATASVAELISNAWDADAKNVWVTIPFEAWRPESEILVVDDGSGMTRQDARDAYLVVGRKRRLESGERTPSGRHVHGRKGIGKLAAFGTAGVLECTTVRAGEVTAFRLDYDSIRKLKPTEDYPVEVAEDASPLTSPITQEPLETGTRIRLTHLWLKRALADAQFIRSMSRRFALAQTEMKVFINGKMLQRFDMPLQFKFPEDGLPSGEIAEEDGWAIEHLPSGRAVRWWIGFTDTPLDDESLQGISVLANGKMAQRPFMFERSSGTTGQLGQEYMVGEVLADWLDQGADIDTDFIQSNRDQLQLEDERLEEFILWGRRRLAWALRERNGMRAERALATFEATVDVSRLLEPYTSREQRSLMRIARIAANMPEVGPSNVHELMEQVINTRDDVMVRQMMEEIENEPEPFQERMWALVHEFGLLDARKNLSIIEARLDTIGRLRQAIDQGAREVPDIHNIIRQDAWLLDPRWHLLDDEVPVSDLGVGYDPETDAETGQQLDYLFVLQPAAPAPVDQVIVVEIKRGTYPSGRTRKADGSEVVKFHNYVRAVKTYQERNTTMPTVRGLMIAQDYTEQADGLRRSFEQLTDPRMEFKTWARVIEETERMHLGWLAVSRRRATDEAR